MTKYDSARRNEDGSYMDQQEWTCISDIGKDCGGTLLCAQDYLATETRYVNAVQRHFVASGLANLRVTNLSNKFTKHALSELAGEYPDLGHPVLEALDFVEDQIVGQEEIELLVRQNLRGTIDCKLEFDGQFFVHFSWDYYMYIGCAADCCEAQAKGAGQFA